MSQRVRQAVQMTSGRFDREVTKLATRLFGRPEPPTSTVTMLAMEYRALPPKPRNTLSCPTKVFTAGLTKMRL